MIKGTKLYKVRIIYYPLNFYSNQIYFWDTDDFIEMPIHKSKTVKEVIKLIMEAYLKDENLDDSKLQYPDKYEGNFFFPKFFEYLLY